MILTYKSLKIDISKRDLIFNGLILANMMKRSLRYNTSIIEAMKITVCTDNHRMFDLEYSLRNQQYLYEFYINTIKKIYNYISDDNTVLEIPSALYNTATGYWKYQYGVKERFADQSIEYKLNEKIEVRILNVWIGIDEHTNQNLSMFANLKNFKYNEKNNSSIFIRSIR